MDSDTKHLGILRDRLKKIDIEVDFIVNFPWVYLYKINSKRVTERFEGNHGFTVAFLPVRRDMPFHFTDIREIFKLIRKYI